MNSRGRKSRRARGAAVICEMAKTIAERTRGELSGEAFLPQEQARPRRHPSFPAQTAARWEGLRTAASAAVSACRASRPTR